MERLREGLAQLLELLANLNMKHALIVVGVLVATLALWRCLPDRALGAARRRSLIENTQVALSLIVVIFLLIRPYVFQAFFIPSDSMVPTFQRNDRLVVNKLIYRFAPPSRGDVVVFIAPEASNYSGKEFIKRVAGTPGDRVEIVGRRLVADGLPVLDFYSQLATLAKRASEPVRGIEAGEVEIDIQDQTASVLLDSDELCQVVLAPLNSVRYDGGRVRVGDQTFGGTGASERLIRMGNSSHWGTDPALRCQAYVREGNTDLPALIVVEARRLGEERPHLRVNGKPVREPYLAEEMTYVLPPVEVPPGYYMMLGDNRNDSHDSHEWGLLSAQRIIGRAEVTFWPIGRWHVLNWWLILALGCPLTVYAAGRWLITTLRERQRLQVELSPD